MAPPTTLHDRLRVARERAGLDIGTVAERLGRTPYWVECVERGDQRTFSLDTAAFAHVYGVTWDWLTFGRATPRDLMSMAPAQRDGILRDAADIMAEDAEYLALLQDLGGEGG